MPSKAYMGTCVVGPAGPIGSRAGFPENVVFDTFAGDTFEEVRDACYAHAAGRRACIVQEFTLLVEARPVVPGGFPPVGWHVSGAWLCEGQERKRLPEKLRWDVRPLMGPA